MFDKIICKLPTTMIFYGIQFVQVETLHALCAIAKKCVFIVSLLNCLLNEFF